MSDKDRIAVLNAALTRMQGECNRELEKRRAAEQKCANLEAGLERASLEHSLVYGAWRRDRAARAALEVQKMTSEAALRAALLGARDTLENTVDFAPRGSEVIQAAQHRIHLINEFLRSERREIRQNDPD